MYAEAVADLNVLKRSAIVNQLHAGMAKLAVEMPVPMVPEAVMSRSDS
jgi:hypothetical protein